MVSKLYNNKFLFLFPSWPICDDASWAIVVGSRKQSSRSWTGVTRSSQKTGSTLPREEDARSVFESHLHPSRDVLLRSAPLRRQAPAPLTLQAAPARASHFEKRSAEAEGRSREIARWSSPTTSGSSPWTSTSLPPASTRWAFSLARVLFFLKKS